MQYIIEIPGAMGYHIGQAPGRRDFHGSSVSLRCKSKGYGGKTKRMTTDQVVLSVTGLTKNFGGLQAVRGVDFEVEKGAIVGLIGPNGAGKTTTFNMIAGELTPSAGKISLLGEDITGQRTDMLYHKGLMRTFQLSHEYARMTALENLAVAAPSQTGESIWSSWFAAGKTRKREAEVMELAQDTLAFLGMTHVCLLYTSPSPRDS